MCVFSQNRALWHGGAFCGSSSSPQFDECRFLQNQASTAGAVIVFYGSQPRLRTCHFAGNSTDPEGNAALYISCFVEATLEDCTFVGNHTSGSGPILGMGKMDCLTLRGCTFWGDETQDGAVIRAGELEVTLENTLVTENRGSLAVAGEALLTLSCCDLFVNQNADGVVPIGDLLGAHGNICEDPLLCDPAAGDLAIDCASPGHRSPRPMQNATGWAPIRSSAAPHRITRAVGTAQGRFPRMTGNV
ncbi:MAG: hypothetical protein GF330_06640 [Candidatus Eisenbacteria bacterium]|nr:hypothetical protein [Candidatus Eisenbacteria bacterium]